MAAEIIKTAISDMGTMLFKETAEGSGEYSYLMPITTAPATGSAPAQIAVTELDSPYVQNILDRESTPAFDFGYNYLGTRYASLSSVFDGFTTHNFLLVFGDGSGFKFSGVGKTYTEAVSAGGAVTGTASVAVTHKEFVASVSTLIDDTSIPVGRVFNGTVIA